MPDTTMTLNLREDEMAVLNSLAERKGMSKTSVMRQALKLYQMVDKRLSDGERLMFSGDQGKLPPSEIAILI